MDRKELFREWLKNKVDTIVPLSAYPNALSNFIPKELSNHNENSYKDLFECIDIEYLNKLYTRLSKGGDLHQFNVNTQSRLPSASVKKYIEFLKSLNNNETKEVGQYKMKTKNIMLYGAPGVGKTHNYKRLITMIENGSSESEIFETIKNNDNSFNDEETFENIKKEKRVEFVTFHQSYSYEDFIEGFRPSEEDEKIVRQDGIFKIISDKAKKNLENSQIPKQEYKIDIEEVIQKFTNYVQDSLDNEKEFFIDKKVTIKGINDNNAFLLGGSITSPQRLTPDIIKRDYIEFKNGNIKSYEDVKPTYESQRNFHGNARYYFMIYNKIAEFEKTLNINTIQKQREEQKNFYIVIDEINRGNISKIFGELITLIEEDKRDSYEVTLPYSKEKFKIPSNLYIIATMNSTDKSIATIDIALRRRFTFLKMKPNPKLVQNDNARQLMKELNQYISKSFLGEDYQLGHSYFMGEDIDVEFIKEYKIKPLLEEYFYSETITPDEIIKKAKSEYKEEVIINPTVAKNETVDNDG